MDFKAINFGRADAHTEGEEYPELLSRGYLNVSSVAEKALGSNVFLFLGYKGSGKSSLSEHLRLNAGETIVDQQRLTDFPFKEFDKILDKEDKIIRYKKLWRWILLVKVFCDFYSDSTATIQSREDLQKVISVFAEVGLFPIMNLTSLIKKSITNNVKASIKLLEIGRTEIEEKNDVNIELLTDYIQELITSFKESKMHIMIIDDLDDILSPKGLQFSILSALINEVRALNRFFKLNFVPIKILVLCRTDMFERLPDPNKNKIKQDNSFTFTWYREGINKPDDSDLIKLIDIRAKLVYPEINGVLQTFFPESYDKKDTYTALLDFTRHTPRDFIQLINHIQDQCQPNTELITSGEIEKGIKEYSTEYFKQEIQDELAGYLPSPVIEAVFNSISSIRNRSFSYKEFIKQCVNYDVLKSYDLVEIMKILYDCSAIGHYYEYTKSGKPIRYTFKYRNRASAFNPSDLIILHKGLWKALNVNY
jgi:hypothetical protein